VVCHDNPAFQDDELADLKFRVSNCVPRDSGVNGAVEPTEKGALTPFFFFFFLSAFVHSHLFDQATATSGRNNGLAHYQSVVLSCVTNNYMPYQKGDTGKDTQRIRSPDSSKSAVRESKLVPKENQIPLKETVSYAG
jgi:hypothetical protein